MDTSLKGTRIKVKIGKSSNEIENQIIAMFPKEVNEETTYIEIHPSMMLSVCSSIINFLIFVWLGYSWPGQFQNSTKTFILYLDADDLHSGSFYHFQSE